MTTTKRRPRVAAPEMIRPTQDELVKATAGNARGAGKSAGVSGLSHAGGYVADNERSADLTGTEKYRTFTDTLVNFAICATGLRYHLNLVAAASWKYKPADDSSEAQRYAELLEDIMTDISPPGRRASTPWSRVVRRLALYRFLGSAIEAKRAKLREDGVIGLHSLQRRPMVTIERWEFDEDNGDEVLAAYQRSPQDGREYRIDRWQMIYIVDDSISDLPAGVGLARHLVEPARKLKVYERLEGIQFQNDCRNIAVLRAPLSELRKALDPDTKKPLTRAQITQLLEPLETFVERHGVSPERGLLLDSKTYTDSGSEKKPTGVYQYDLELKSAGSNGNEQLNQAIERKTRELARILHVEHLLMGSDGKGSLALGEDKSNNFAVLIKGTLDDIAEVANNDVVSWLWQMNGFPPELQPEMRPEAVQHRDVLKITKALADMASAGAMLAPNDPAINDVRDILEIGAAPEMDEEEAALLRQSRVGIDPNIDPDEDDEEVDEDPKPKSGKPGKGKE